jgi:tetratricopeptide (TPR) repeat protein
MASRINLRLIIILAVVLIGAAGLIGGFFYLQHRGDAARLERQGDDAMAIGDVETAKSAYMRAARREPGTERYIEKTEDALRQIVPETVGQARERYGELIAVLRYRVNHAPSNAENHINLIEELVNGARQTGAVRVWGEVDTAAGDMWAKLSSADPQRIEAKLYEAIAVLQPSRIGTSSDDELARGREAIETYLEANPSSGRGWAVLIDHHRARLTKARAEGQPMGEEEFAEVWAVVEQARQAVDSGVELPVAVLDLAEAERRIRGASSLSEDDLSEIASTLDSRVEAIDDVHLVSAAANAIQGIFWVDDRPDALLVVDRYLEERPDTPVLRYVRARFLYRLRKLDDAEADAKSIVNADLLPVSYEAQLLFLLRQQATGLLCDIEFQRWAQAEESERSAHLATLREHRDSLESMVFDKDENSLLLLADAKIAMAENDSAEAVRKFERLLSKVGSADVETLVYASAVLEQEGSFGPALERIAMAIEAQPGNVPLWIRKIELEMRLNDFEAALESAETALRNQPDDERLLGAYNVVKDRIARAEGSMVDPVARVAQEAQGFVNREEFGEARRIVQAGMDEFGEQALLLHTMAVIERRAGAGDEAILRWLERGLELYPDSEIFATMIDGITSADDPIRRIELQAERQFPDDPAERFARLFVDFDILTEMQDRLIAEYEEADNAADAEEARALRDRAREMAESSLRSARAEDPNHPILVNRLFTRSLESGRETGEWSEAQTLANRAAEANLDGANGKLFFGRLAWAQQDTENAIALLEEVTKEIPHDPAAWRAYALSQLGVGNVRAALDAFEEAYRRNPMDLATVRPYVDLLLRAGERTRALLILQKARRLAAADVRVRETWLALEGEIGDKAEVLKRRRQLWELNPGNRLNAAQLVSFLSRTEPDRTTILDEEGRVEYTPATWDRLTQREQQRLIQMTKSDWEQEAGQILEQMAPPSERSVSWHALKADLLRESGDVAGGEAVLREFMMRQSEPANRVRAGIALGQYLAQAQRFNDAVSVFESVQPDQNSERREADLALANLFFQLAEYRQAAELLEQVYAASPSRRIGIRLVESQMNSRNIETARRSFDRLKSDGLLEDEDSESRLVEAALVDAEADQLWATGENAAAEAKIQRFQELVDQVIELDPANSKPYVLRARTLVKAYRRAGDPVLLDDALFALTRADEVRGDQIETSMVRIAVYQAQGEVGRAINELKRLLDRSPDLMRARITLIQTLVQQGEFEDAADIITDAIAQTPGSAMWLNYRGSLYLDQMDEPRLAVTDFTESFRLEPTATNLARLLTALMRVAPPEHQRVVRLLREHRDLVDEQPQLQALAAEAMALSGDRVGAIEELRRSYGLLEEMIQQNQLSVSQIQSWFDSVARVFGAEEVEQANAFVRELLDDEPNIQENRALARMWAIGGRFEDAAELQRFAIEQAAGGGAALLGGLNRELAGYCIQIQDWECAVNAYETALQYAANDVTILNNVAFILAEELSDPRRALPFAERAAQLAPNDANILDTLGRVQFLLGNLEEAERQLRQSTQLNELASAYLHLAEVYAAQDDFRRARRALERAQELNPDPQTQAEIARVADDIRTRSGR